MRILFELEKPLCTQFFFLIGYFTGRPKRKVGPVLKFHDMKAYSRMEIKVHAFLTKVLDVGDLDNF
jgi:hypothetical protein